MTDRNIELTRRKILASVGAVGAAGAAAGWGTSAYFSDVETFSNNQLTAGELDLKVDWEEHYSDWMGGENVDIPEENPESEDDDGEGEFEIRMEPPEGSNYKAFPPGTGVLPDQDPLIWVPEAYVDDFMANTAIDSFPDVDNDGSAEFPVSELSGYGEICEFLADVGDDDDGLATYTTDDENTLGRTDNEDTRIDGEPAPLINLQDVKPGDFGEVTLSVHLCGNPGYLWMNMPGGLETSENGVNEPEAKDEDEDQNEDLSVKSPDPNQDGPTVELADKLQTAIWYDNGDNLLTCEDKIDVMLLADTSDSIDGSLIDNVDDAPADRLKDAGNLFLNQLDQQTDDGQLQAGLVTFNGSGDAGTDPDPAQPGQVFPRPAWRAGLGPVDQFDTDGDGFPNLENFLPVEGNGATPMPHGIDLTQKILLNEGRPDAKQIIVMVTDGLPDYADEESPTTPYTVEENEGSALTPTGNTYTSEDYESPGGSDGTSTQTEQQETEDEAVEVQGDDIAIRVVGVDLGGASESVGPTAEDPVPFLRDRIAGDDADPTESQDDFFYPAPDFDALIQLASDVSEDITGGVGECEEIITSGTLREVAAELSTGPGIPLEGNLPAEDGGGTGRNCFNPNATHHFGFSWWLPLNHGNEVQTDSVNFDLGFYTEQCRHNTGEGMANQPDA